MQDAVFSWDGKIQEKRADSNLVVWKGLCTGAQIPDDRCRGFQEMIADLRYKYAVMQSSARDVYDGMAMSMRCCFTLNHGARSGDDYVI